MATNQQILDGIVLWAKTYAGNDSYTLKEWTSKDSTHKCPLCHPGSGDGWSNIGFVTAAIYHGGGIHDVTCHNAGIGSKSFLTTVTLAKWRERNGVHWDLVDNGGSKTGLDLPASVLRKGDVLLKYDKSTGDFQRASIYMGNGKVALATKAKKPKNEIRVVDYSSHKCTRAFRFNSSGGAYKPFTSAGNSAASSSEHTFTRRVGPTKYGSVKNLIYYKDPNPFSVNGKTGGNCTWWAWGRFWEVWAGVQKKWQKKNPWYDYLNRHPNGNAYAWYSDAQNSGKLKTGVKPKPGAIICWGYGSSGGSPGHVAFVEKVNTKKNGDVKSIEVSQSGWSSGPLGNVTLYPGNGKRGHDAYSLGYNNSYFNGFIYNPINFGNPAGATDSDYGFTEEELAEMEEGEVVYTVDMAQRIATLYSSDNFTYPDSNVEEDSENKSAEAIKKFVANSAYVEHVSEQGQAVPEPLMGKLADDSITENRKIYSSSIPVSQALVEAPFIEVEINGYKIGSYFGSVDKYPNYLSALHVKKVNGELNEYTLNLVHQIRPGEDPNLLDKLFSVAKYNPITIRYGDSTSSKVFADTEAIISNIVMNRDYSGSKITYTVYALSASNYIGSYKTSFGAVSDKPSNVLKTLLYDSGEISSLLQEAFPGMKNRTYVELNNLIPSNDNIVNLKAKTNTNVISYINYVTGSMSNSANETDAVIRDSVYYISYHDDITNGNYFKVSEVSKTNNLINAVYDVTVGYPSTDVFSFTIDNNDVWAMLYEHGSEVNEQVYSIDANGNIGTKNSYNLVNSTIALNEIQKNWWTQVTQYPTSAQLTLRGMLTPLNLMDYINVNVVFYGQPHITSGLYVITGQQDILNSAGFKTILSLTRVQDN